MLYIRWAMNATQFVMADTEFLNSSVDDFFKTEKIMGHNSTVTTNRKNIMQLAYKMYMPFNED